MKTQLGMTRAELVNLPVSVDLVTAGRALGVGRTKSYELVRAGRFPVPVLRLGTSYRVTRADLLRALGVVEDERAGSALGSAPGEGLPGPTITNPASESGPPPIMGTLCAPAGGPSVNG